MDDYISREAALTDFESCNAENPNWTPQRVKTLLIRQPAADVAPVVHGRWILLGKNEHDYETSVEEKCSLCGRYVYRYDTELQDNYCPNCGCKMDKEAECETDRR